MFYGIYIDTMWFLTLNKTMIKIKSNPFLLQELLERTKTGTSEYYIVGDAWTNFTSF